MNFLFISASYPLLKDGISDGAEKIYTHLNVKGSKLLLTTDTVKISSYLKSKNVSNYELIPDWRLNVRNIKKLLHIINQYNIDTILIEYPGKGYGTQLFINIVPFLLKCMNKKVYIRLHEYTQSRRLRKLVTIPMILFADKVFIPSYVDRKYLEKTYRKKIQPTYIGSNIDVASKSSEKNNSVVCLSYFGFIYKNKGVERLLEIFHELKKRNTGINFSYKILAELNPSEDTQFGAYHKRILEKIEKLGMKEDIEISGYLPADEVSGEISKTDIAVLPFDDGLTLRRGSFLTYFIHGIPVVTAKGDKECSELFKNCSGVRMVQTVEEYCDVIIAWAKNRSEVKADMVSNEISPDFFNWDKIGKDLLMRL